MVTHTDGGITYTVTLEIKEMLERAKRIEQALDELKRNSNNAAGGLDSLERSANSAGAGLGKLSNIAKAVSAALLSSKVIAYAESWNELEDRIQNTGATASQTKDILDQLLVTSDRNGRSINESAELYVRLSNSMSELGYSTQGTLSYIDTLSNLMTINKTNSLSAESAINALTKAQMKGKLAGIDAMTVFNAMPSILKTLANQMKKNAKSTEEADKITEQYVRELASKGKLSMEQFTQATIDAQEETARLANNMRNTVNDALTRVTNNLKKYFGELNNSSGATQLLVDSLILMSQHVDVLVNGIGALAAIYAGKYITSLANATKQSVEKTINNIKNAKTEKVAAQAAVDRAKEELRLANATQRLLNIQLKLARTEKERLAISKKIETQDKLIETRINALTAAQTRLNVASKAASLTLMGLRGAMSLLGGPAGILFLVAGALAAWASNAAAAKQKAIELTDEVAGLTEKWKGMSQVQREAFVIELKKRVLDQNKAIEKQVEKIDNLKKKLSLVKNGYYEKFGKDEKERTAAAQKLIDSETKLLDVMIEGRNKATDSLDELIVEIYKAANSTDKAAKSGENLTKNWDNAAKSEIDKKVASLSKELDVATLKAEGNSKAAFILEGLYSVLGDRANEYSEDLINLVTNQATVTKLTNDQVKALQPLIEGLRSLSVENEKIKKAQKSNKETTKSYAEEVKELSDKLEVAKLEAKGMTVEAELLSITQKMGGKVTAEQTAKLKELIEKTQAYKELGALKSPIDVEEDSYKKSRDSLDKLQKLGEIKKQEEYNAKLEQLEQQHQINMAKIKSEVVVSKVDDAVAQVDPVQALENEHKRKLALIQEFEKQKWMTEENAIALREAASRQYEQNRINAQWEIWRNQSDANELLASTLEGLASSATSTISGLLSGTMNAAEAMKNFANIILNEAIGSLVQMGMQYVKNAIIAKTASAATTTAQVGEAAALAIAYEPAAMLASIASFGAAADTGAASFAGAIGSMKALSIAGARKNGGPVSGDSLYRVGEGGKPEILMQGNRQYLIPGENGKVLSNRQMQANQNPNIQWNFIVENYANGVEVSTPSVDFENRIVKTAVKQAKQEVANDISNHSGNVWRAMENSTNIHSKL